MTKECKTLNEFTVVMYKQYNINTISFICISSWLKKNDGDACRNHYMMLIHVEVIIHVYNTKVVYNVCTVKSFLEVISHSTSSGQWTINILISSGMGAQIGKHANVVTSSC